MWTCGCWLCSWGGWWGHWEISTICLTARSEGHIIQTNITSIAVTTNTFKYHLKRPIQCNHIKSHSPKLYVKVKLDESRQITRMRSEIKPGSFCWTTTAPLPCSTLHPVNPLCSTLFVEQCHSGNSWYTQSVSLLSRHTCDKRSGVYKELSQELLLGSFGSPSMLCRHIYEATRFQCTCSSHSAWYDLMVDQYSTRLLHLKYRENISICFKRHCSKW